MKIRFIFNPHSGRNRRDPRLRERARRFLAEERLVGEVVETERPRHATDLAAAAVADGCTLVVAIGGDGTMNEVATALTGTPVIFGLIPCGSGNGLGRHLGIPGPGEEAFRTLLHGRPRAIDTGRVNGFAFFNAMGLGFEAEIAVRFARLERRGLAGYVRVGIPAFFRHTPEVCTIHVGPDRLTREVLTLAVMNSDQYGNDAVVAPGARVDDGRFDLVAVPPVGLLRAGALLGRLATRTFDRAAGVTRAQADRLVIKRPKPGWIHTDGEPRATTARLEVSLRPRSLRVMVPVTAAGA